MRWGGRSITTAPYYSCGEDENAGGPRESGSDPTQPWFPRKGKRKKVSILMPPKKLAGCLEDHFIHHPLDGSAFESRVKEGGVREGPVLRFTDEGQARRGFEQEGRPCQRDNRENESGARTNSTKGPSPAWPVRVWE
jgi:hypothetical protein